MLNNLSVMGRLVATPELRKTPTGVSTTTITIACDRDFVAPGEQRQTDFLDIEVWRQKAEFVCKYFTKGQLIAARGRIQTRAYDDKEGKRRKVYYIKADDVFFADSKKSPGQAPADELPPDDFTPIDDTEDLPF